MKNNIFNAMCDDLMRIAIAPNRDELLNVFMSQGYLFINLTDKQVDKLRVLFAACYPDIYEVFDEPDEHGFTAQFKYLLFK